MITNDLTRPIAWADPMTIAELAEGGEDFPNPTLSTRNRGVFSVPLYTHPPASEAQGRVAVKPLEWELVENDWWGATALNHLIYEVREGKASVRIRFPGSRGFEVFDGTVEQAKDAAQANFEHLMRSALTPEAQGNTLRLAVAAVLEADKEFRSNLPPDWEGDPLSDELDGLRRVFEALSTPEQGETEAVGRQVVGQPVVPITAEMPELRISLIARAVRQSLRNYGHKVAESTLPECIAGDVERTLVAHEKTWAKPPRDCGVNGGDLSESLDNIGSSYTRITPSPSPSEDHKEADRLRRMVERRDEFIIGNGLWDEFKEASHEAK